ncbi:MAG: nucleotide exchange factor GrpE, partial [Anaerolineae bacterium]|nr:nucleotide exchange factor GrpE [Anaerolineae bacterium]
PPPSEVAASQAAEMEQLRAELEQWKDRALRLEAEMDNFRKHLQRVTEDRIAADRARLLRDFLDVVDNLARALSANGADAESLRQGVEVTHRSMLHLLNREGVTPIEAEGQPFDPAWHEAVGTVAAQQVGKDPDTVVYVVRQGYRIGDRLLRPTQRVIVATDSGISRSARNSRGQTGARPAPIGAGRAPVQANCPRGSDPALFRLHQIRQTIRRKRRVSLTGWK